MSERAAPFYCPYCGDEDLRPSEEAPRGTQTRGTEPRGEGAAWECRSCNRAFRLSFLGLLAKGLRRDHREGGTTS
ncbi:hypothetical protein RKE29_07155 [Streptomyces sp. B1866]|uniref:hypothetical protein n=1 Tax=Streptomyces sp. B1866 TaxID=3075431 RepID=UPI00288D0DAD|nr:hypothetical protein [Streptomyces sp. B1866]MDT3396420.1 hypothetical protein [Streptomyces sp. B1866]